MNEPGVPPLQTLSGRTLATLKAFFDQQSHHPSDEHWEALEDIATTLEDMADEACEPKVYLSAVDPGVGKTQTLTHFAKALTEARHYRDVGMIVAVGRVREAEDLAAALISLGVASNRFAVLTHEKEANALGSPDVGTAQVLITTQQRIELKCRACHFADVVSLFYEGRPRQVRAWDEAFLPGVAVTISRDLLYGIIGPITRLSVPLGERIRAFADSMIGSEDGDMVEVPDWDAEFGISQRKIEDAFSDDWGADRRTGTGLMSIGGRCARVVRENNGSQTLLTYRETIPADLAPMVVLDASIRVRDIYEIMVEHRGNFVEMTTAAKDYSPLKVHVWRTSGSKTGFSKDHDRLVAGIVEIIKSKPDEKWLAVVHKPSKDVADVEAATVALLPPEIAGNVSTLTWGQHMGTNLYRDYPNVILAGTLFTKKAIHQALANLAQDRDMRLGFADRKAVDRIEHGEHAHMILQALCRGRVRKCEGSKCHPMDAYIIAATRHGIPKMVKTIFPGCTVRNWTPGTRHVLKGKLAEAMEIVEEAMRPGGPGVITYATVREALKMDKTNFRRSIREHADWRQAIDDSPYMETDLVMGVGRGAKQRGLRREDRQDCSLAA